MTLDYFGIRPECGCITAWMSATYSTKADIRKFYRDMADSGREVRRMEFTEELRQKLDRCPHMDAAPSDDAAPPDAAPANQKQSAPERGRKGAV